MNKLKLALLPVFFTFLCFAQPGKKYNSLFWEISGNGLSKPSYLYGTMHVSNKVAFHLSDSFFIAIKNVDVVGLETNPEEWMEELYGQPQNGIDISKSNPQSTSSFYKNCFFLNLPSNKELKGVLKYYPQIVNSLLYRKRDGQDNFEENTYLDLFLMQSGRKYGKAIASLENYKESQMLVDKASESIDENEEDQISYYKKSKLLKGSTYSDLIEDVYRKGDLDYMDSISHVFYPSKNYNKYMLELRNESMVKSMDSIMRKKSLFTGVGAAHLPGDKGVISLLIKKGYRVRPIFLNSELESPYKEEVEKLKYPVSFSSYTDPDSVFSVEVPGKMYEVSKTKSYKYYLYPDMANGCFYMVMTVQNYSALLGVKPAEYMKKLDSLLFENIPGKITKKTPFTADNGWIGYDIENVTKRGDYQYYRIVFAPSQLIVVKVNGNGEYAKGEEAQRFLHSAKFYDVRSKNFKTHSFPELGSAVYMPAKLQTQHSKEYNYRTYAQFIANGFDENNKQYTFIRSVYHDFKYLEEDTFELNVLAESFCKEQSMKLLSKKILPKTAYPSLHFTAEYNGKEFQGRILLAQPFYYMLLSSAKDKNSEKFFNSLQLSDMKNKLPLSSYTDSTLFFKVNTIQLTDTDKKYLAAYEEKKPKSSKKDPEPKKYYFSRTHYFYAPNTGECMMVEANRFSKYSNVSNADTFWVKRGIKYAYGKDLVLKNKRISIQPDLQQGWFNYTDTNTNQVITMRVILKGDVIYVLRSNTDSTRQHSNFCTEFMKSFTPSDTLIGNGIYVSKASEFFADIYSKDKATQLGAKNAIEARDVDFYASDDTIILRNLKNPAFHPLSLTSKVNILRGLTESKRPEITGELKKLYETYADSTELQVVVLQVLADLKTEAATKTLLELLINDTPPLDRSGDALDILYPYFDTLALTKYLYPKLLDLTRYAEYKTSVHKLLAWAVYKKVLGREAYADYKPFLYKECKDELKRQFSLEKESTKSYNRFTSDAYTDTQKEPAELEVFRNESDRRSPLGNEDLYALYILIAPFREEAQARTLIGKVQNLTDLRTKSAVLSYLISEGINSPDSVIQKLSASEESRTFWYMRLKKYNKESLFDKTYLNQRSFAHALLFGDMKLNETEDTVLFMEKRNVNIRNHSGIVYFYKLKKKDDINFTIYAAGVFPSDEKTVIAYNMVSADPKEVEKGDKEKELIDEMLQQIRMKNRKRAGHSSSYF